MCASRSREIRPVNIGVNRPMHMDCNASSTDPDSRKADDRAFVDSLAARPKPVTVSVRGNALKFRPYLLTDADRAFVRQHRESLKALIRSGYTPAIKQPAPAPPPTKPDPVPTIFVGGKQVTEVMVMEALSRLGDERLADYLLGRISKSDAYAQTRIAIEARAAMRTGNLRRFGRGLYGNRG
jgi:hypothetical protein